MSDKFKYDAFISYRHTELDKFVAENLHKQLEAFHFPKGLAKKRKGQKNKIERVFRDKDELPLTSNLEDPILQALNSSEWLIVICSPRLRESMWCKKEIETFVSLRGREHVLAVLVEGEPAESFPDELLYKLEDVKQPDGSVKQVKIPVEPLAADVRGETRKDVLKAMKTEIMRILAAMFQVDYDDLRQRHRERKMRRIVGASLLVGAACLLFGAYSTITALRIKEQKDRIEEQSEQILAQSEEILEQHEALKLKSEEIRIQNEAITKQNEAITKQNAELALRQANALAEEAGHYLEQGNRKEAVQTAVESLTESDGISMPLTAGAQMVLTESLRLYDTGAAYRAQYQYEMPGRILYILESVDSDTLAIYDATSTMTLYDVEKKEVIETFSKEDTEIWFSHSCTFIGEDKFAYLNSQREVCIYDLNEKKIVEKLADEIYYEAIADETGKYLMTKEMSNEYKVYDGATLQHICTIPQIEDNRLLPYSLILPDGIYVNGYTESDENGNLNKYLYFYDVNTQNIRGILSIEDWDLEDIKIRDSVAYIALARFEEERQEYYMRALAFQMDTGVILWSNEQQGQYDTKIKLSGNPQGQCLIVVSRGLAQIIDMETGSVLCANSVNSPVIEILGYADSDNFMMFCQNGEMVVYNREYNMVVEMTDRFECKTGLNSYIIHSKYGISVLENNDNKVTIYTNAVGKDLVETQEAHKLPDGSEEITNDEAFEIARTYGLDNPEYVEHLYYSDDGRYCFIYYWDESFHVYDTVAGKIIGSMDDAYPTYWFMGTDAQGYSYLLGYFGCYIMNQDMEAVTWVANCKDVDIKNRKLYLTDSQYNYEAPVYSVEELLQAAKELGYLDK